MNKEKIASELLKIAKDLVSADRVAGCEKLPEGKMRDMCEKKKEEGKDNKDKKANSRMAKFPPKALDLNKLPNTDGFWGWSIADAKKYSGASLRPDNIGDVIFWLNMTGAAWARAQK